MTNSLTYMIVILGAATVALSLYVAFCFLVKHVNMKGDGRALTGALMLQLFGEAALGAGTLLFAILAHTGHLPHIPVVLQSSLRFIMFGVTAATTVHLFVIIARLDNE